jgi:hypothetical protein
MSYATSQGTQGNTPFPPLAVSIEMQGRIHKMAERYGASDELEQAMCKIYLLEKHAESVDHCNYPQVISSFSQSAAEHYRVSMDESRAKQKIEEILLKNGSSRADAWQNANAITRQVIALAWENPHWL